MKKILSIAVVAGTLLSVASQPSFASAESALLPPGNSEAVTSSSISMNESEAAWNTKAAEIIKKYKPGQPFSEEDADFFRQSSSKDYSRGLATSVNLFGYHRGTFNGDAWISETGSRVAFWGYVDTDFGVINHETKTNIMIKDDKLNSHKKLNINLHVNAIGPLGTGGTKVGIVADFDISNSTENSHQLWQGKSHTWTAVPMYVYYTAKGTVTDNNSEVDITPTVDVKWSQTKP
ncbi:hypothetical protein SAMN04487970_105523 [Paenibacillus tianmuensis]|uniref:Uncharacterized protein n=1 Tax=Paenibacillus tianmuensis TaxID=624147 RepID=A0A1G4TLV1_9BACL|nr:hypothetical protein SAMN04487970_105523 [Paenibacillus tianmuensis]